MSNTFDYGMSGLGAEQDELLGDSDEDVHGDGMADEIANMLADLRNTGEAEDDADIDLALEEQLLAVDTPPKTSISQPVLNPFQPTTAPASKEMTATVNPFAPPPDASAPPPAIDDYHSSNGGFGAPTKKLTASVNPFAPPPLSDGPPPPFEPPKYSAFGSSWSPAGASHFSQPTNPFSPKPEKPLKPQKPLKTTANPFAASSLNSETETGTETVPSGSPTSPFGQPNSNETTVNPFADTQEYDRSTTLTGAVGDTNAFSGTSTFGGTVTSTQPKEPITIGESYGDNNITEAPPLVPNSPDAPPSYSDAITTATAVDQVTPESNSESQQQPYLDQQQIQVDQLEAEILEAERLEAERVAAERVEAERVQQQQEQEQRQREEEEQRQRQREEEQRKEQQQKELQQQKDKEEAQRKLLLQQQQLQEQQQQQQQQDQEQKQALATANAALDDATKINAGLTQEVANQKEELAQTKAELEQSKATLQQAMANFSTLQENYASVTREFQASQLAHKNETRVLAAEVHRLRSVTTMNADDKSAEQLAAMTEKINMLQRQHIEQVQALQQQLQEERLRSTKAQEVASALKMELQSTQQRMEKISAAHDQQQQTLEQLGTALQTSQSQLEQSQSERAAANRLHEAKVQELHKRLQIAETAAATVAVTAGAKHGISRSNVPVTPTEQPITESNVVASAPASSQKPVIQYYSGPFVADQEVQARWKTQKEWINSRILAVNPDGTYRVVYEGQHVAGNVPQSSIRSTHPPPEIPSVDEIPEPPEDSDDPMVLFPGHKIVDVVARRHPTRGFGLKFKLINSGDVNQALYISEVSDPSSGLKASDKLYSVDGQRANSFRGLKPLIADKEEIKLRVLRASLVVQGVDLDSLSTIELKKMLRERNFDTKCNRAAAIKKLTMSLDNEADEDEPKPEETRPSTKFQIFAVPAYTLLSSRQSCLRSLATYSKNSPTEWVMVDTSAIDSPTGSIDSPVISEVLSRWTRDRDKSRRFYMWMKHVVDGRLSGEGFAWSIEIPTLNLAALAGFTTKIVPLLNRLSPWASVSVCVRHSRKFSKANPMLLKPIDTDEQNAFTVDLRVCLNKFQNIDVSGLQAPKFALFGPGSEPIQMFLQSWTSDSQRISKMNSWLKMTAESRFQDPNYHKGIELQSIRKEIALAFLTLVVPLLRQRGTARIVVSLRRARLGIRMAAAGRAMVERPKMDLIALLEDVDFADAEFDMQLAAIV